MPPGKDIMGVSENKGQMENTEPLERLKTAEILYKLRRGLKAEKS